MKVTAAIRVAAILTIAFALTPAVRAADDPAEGFLRWHDAVVNHEPGKADGALDTVWKMRPIDRANVTYLLKDYLRLMASPGALMPVAKATPSGLEELDPRIAAAARHDQPRMTIRTFLERGAMLHADAVMFDRRSPAERAATDSPPPDLPRANVLRQYLERPSNYVTVDDGEVTGLAGANPNWTFARLLLDRIKPIPPDDVFVAAWYHGAASFLLRRGNFAEVVPLLDHAVEILPEDARILFDRGTVEESFAMGLFQQASTSPEDRHTVVIPGTSLTSKPVRDVTLGSPLTFNARARGSYERAIEINPGLIEAHVRLARQLELIDQFTRAASEVKAALALDPAPDVAFYAHLLGTRAANALGRDDDAEAHVQAALQLYPEADSAWLAASQTSLHRSDPGAAIERLGKLTEAQDSTAPTTGVRDPWPDYIYGAGRLVKIALTELWGLVPAYTER